MGTKTFQYGPYELVCSATPAGSSFAATLVVALGHDSAREETAVPLDKASHFKSEADAIAHARTSGEEWVDNFG